jgi:hypothetical protein
VGEWRRYKVELGDGCGSAEVEAPEHNGFLNWPGLPGTGLESCRESGPRTEDPITIQVQETASEWFHRWSCGNNLSLTED